MASKRTTVSFAGVAVGAVLLLGMFLTTEARGDDSPLAHPTRTDKSEFTGGVPLGGVGTGTVELRGDGSFREWQIFNNWGNTLSTGVLKYFPPFDLLNAFAAVKIDGRPYVLETHPAGGLPGVTSIDYSGDFPLANLTYHLDRAPVEISAEGFGSYIPHDAKDSGIPAIGLSYKLKNTSAKAVQVSLALSLVNPLGADCTEDTSGALHVAESTAGPSGMAVAALDGTATSVLGGADTAETLKAFWDDFSSATPQPASGGSGQRFGQIVSCQLQPGEEKTERFVVGWFFPDHRENGTGPLVGHQYENLTDSAAGAVNLFGARFDELRKAAAAWRDTMRDASWPDWISHWLCNSQSTIAKYTWWTKDGRFMTYESPECPNGSPVHIIDLADWPVLDAFPELELGMLRHFAEKQESDGKIPEEFEVHDTPSITFPGGRNLYDVNPKYVVEIYHRWRETGNKDFLDATWPTIKKAILYNDQKFDGLKIGLPSGKGIIGTWDHWSNEYGFSYGGCVWMAGLRAAEELAKAEGDTDTATQMHAMYDRAMATMNDHFWNGQFYAMAINQNLEQNNLSFGEAMYGDFFGRVVGLGSILPDDKALATLRAIAKYNGAATPYGIVVTADTSGKMIEYDGDVRAQITTCHEIPAPVALILQGNAADMATGLQLLKNIYAIAEKHPGGLWNMPHHVVAATGERNINDFAHYMRDRCIWSLMKVLNGWSYDAVDQSLAVGPLLDPEKSRGPWICPTAYGTLAQAIDGSAQKTSLQAKDGSLTLAELDVRSRVGKVVAGQVTLGGRPVGVGSTTQDGETVRMRFSAPVTLAAGSALEVSLRGNGAAQ